MRINLRHLLFLLFFLPTVLLAEGNTDSYDPFVDYSEFETSSEEEADIHFFRNGRFLTASFNFGYKSLTGRMADAFDPAFVWGLNLAYFFDLRMAIQLGYNFSNHKVDFSNATGNSDYNSIDFSVKYFFNMQNVTKGLSNLNPYLMAGFSQMYRSSKLDISDVYAEDSAVGFHFAGGFEMPILKNKYFIGAEARYYLVTFPDENTTFHGTSILLEGDVYSITAILGTNF